MGNFAGASQIAADTLSNCECLFSQELAWHLVKVSAPCSNMERRFPGSVFRHKPFDGQKVAWYVLKLPIFSGLV
jgi:hypothetical protein